jgi:hypothetical protein
MIFFSFESLRNGPIKTFDITNKNILFPSLGSLGSVIIIVKQECNLKSRGFNFTLGAAILLFLDTFEASEDSELKDWHTDPIKANTFGCVFISNTSGGQFNIRVLETGEISLPVL